MIIGIYELCELENENEKSIAQNVGGAERTKD